MSNTLKRLQREANVLSQELGIEWPADANERELRYFIGYWHGIDKRPRPRDKDRREGYEQARIDLEGDLKATTRATQEPCCTA